MYKISGTWHALILLDFIKASFIKIRVQKEEKQQPVRLDF